MGEIAGRLHSQQKLLGKIVGVMFPALFGCRTPSELCRVRVGRAWPAGFSGLCPNVPGSSGSGAWRWRCWHRSGAMWRPEPATQSAGSGPGSGMTRCFTSMVSNWVWLAGGGAASKSVCCQALTGSCFWWSLAMVAWVPVDFAIDDLIR